MYIKQEKIRENEQYTDAQFIEQILAATSLID